MPNFFHEFCKLKLKNNNNNKNQRLDFLSIIWCVSHTIYSFSSSFFLIFNFFSKYEIWGKKKSLVTKLVLVFDFNVKHSFFIGGEF